MGLIVKNEQKPREVIPAGVHHAVCYGLYDIGTHYNERYNKSDRKCIILWEFPAIRMEYTKDGVTKDLPKVISKKYTVSLNEKATLRKDLQSWRGKVFSDQELAGFDLKNILGVNCMLQIIHNASSDGQQTYSNIATVLPLYGGIPSVVPETPIQFFSLEESETVPEYTPKWIAELIGKCKELNEYVGHKDEVPVSGEDAPF